MRIFSLLLVAIILAVWLVGAVQNFLSGRKEEGWKRWFTFAAAVFLAVGAIGFFGTFISAMGGLNWLPNSFEWPAGAVNGVVSTKDDYFIVPHTPAGRVQIYDKNWKFVRGWFVDAGGGTFNLNISETNHIHVITARGKKHYVFDFDGKLLSQETYSYQSPPTVSPGRSYVVPTPLWLWTFSSPFLSWATAITGMVVLSKLSTRNKKPADTKQGHNY